MSSTLLLDTGALVSLLDRSQKRHAECAAYFSAWTGEVVTSEAVLTESTHGSPAGNAAPRLPRQLAALADG